jgi:hypothetical protein
MTPSLPDPAASAAVLIGASTFRDPTLSPLPGVANNLTDLAAVLANKALWGLPDQRKSVLHNQTDTGAVIDSLAQLANQARDTFIVYYSGHGLLANDGELLLATPATTAAQAKYTALPYGWVRDIVGQCRAVRRIVILDCCFSGRALNAMSDRASAVTGQVSVAGIYVLTSAPATSPSLALPDARNTAFTGGLLRILHHGVPGADELLTLDDVYDEILLAMARHGWPRPQRLGTNTVGRLAILRNRAWRKRPSPLGSPAAARPDPYRRLASGVREAVSVVAATLGSADRDGLAVLEHAFPSSPVHPVPPSGSGAGIALVRDTMLAMREQYGDGAATAAVILGMLVDGLHAAIESGAQSWQLDIALGTQTTQLAHRLAAGGRSATALPDVSYPPNNDQISAALWTALGRGEVIDAIAAAVRSVGAGNVDVVPGKLGVGEPVAAASTFVLESSVLAPNVARGPIMLLDPLVVVSPDGEIDATALRAAAAGRLPSILIVAPRVSIHTVRGLLHASSRTVVVRPTDATLDLVALRSRLHQGGSGQGWGRARRALVLPTATTIDQPAVDLMLSRNRITLSVADHGGEGQLTLAARALAVARSAADAGVVAGSGAALWAAAQLAGSAGDDPVAAMVSAAAAEPGRLLRLVYGYEGSPAGAREPRPQSQTPPVDCLATVRGAFTHAAATASRSLSVAGDGPTRRDR